MANGAANGSGWRARVRHVIFEADDPAGKAFDVALLACIVVSVAAVMLESVEPIRREWGGWLRAVEWVLTAAFTVEYGLRLWSVERPGRYATSFFGVVDLLAVLPSYLSFVVTGAQSLLVVRVLRLLRVFRVFKMARFLGEANYLLTALRSSARKVAVFLGTVLTIVVVMGSVMYFVERGTAGFENIPSAVYWAIVTLTTVGYGDIVPVTAAGKALAAAIMVAGYGILAVPTGIVTVELSRAIGASGTAPGRAAHACPGCTRRGHDRDAWFCKYCGVSLEHAAENGPDPLR